MAEIFAYILHKDGKADDTAYELINAAAVSYTHLTLPTN